MQALFKTAKYHTAGEASLTEVRGYASKGRPQKGSELPIQGVRFSASLLEDPKKIATGLSKKGFFVLVTNNVDDTSLSSRSPISTYKAQGSTIEGSNIRPFMRNAQCNRGQLLSQSPRGSGRDAFASSGSIRPKLSLFFKRESVREEHLLFPSPEVLTAPGLWPRGAHDPDSPHSALLDLNLIYFLDR